MLVTGENATIPVKGTNGQIQLAGTMQKH